MFLPTTLGGGDALGCTRLDGEHTAFNALDVVGQGIVASLFSVVLHMFLSPNPDAGGMLVEREREMGRVRVVPPAEVVKRLNSRFFLRDDANPCFACAAETHAQFARGLEPSPF